MQVPTLSNVTSQRSRSQVFESASGALLFLLHILCQFTLAPAQVFNLELDKLPPSLFNKSILRRLISPCPLTTTHSSPRQANS